MIQFLFFLALLILPSSAFGAIAVDASITGTGTSITANTTLVITTDNALNLANVGLVMVAFDNTGTTDANHSEISGITDTQANVYTRLAEWTNGQGGAGLGATISLWLTKATTALAATETITITFANTVTAKAATVRELTVTAGNTLQLGGACQTEQMDGVVDPGALVISGLSSKEYFFVRGIARETNLSAAITATTSYTTFGNSSANTGTLDTSMVFRGEYRILTGTGDTSDPSVTNDTDGVSIYCALEEVAVGGTTRRGVAPIWFP